MKKTTTSPAFEFKSLSESSWQEKRSIARTQGLRYLKQRNKNDGEFDTHVLGPSEVRANNRETATFTAVIVQHTWEYERRMKMLKWGRLLVNEAHFLGSFDKELSRSIMNAIQGDLPADLQSKSREANEEIKQLREQRIESDTEIDRLTSDIIRLCKELEVIYPKKDEKYRAVEKHCVDREKHWKEVTKYGKRKEEPLPFAIRNSISHSNKCDWGIEDIETAIEILKNVIGDS